MTSVAGLGAALNSPPSAQECTRCGVIGEVTSIVANCTLDNLAGMTIAAVNLCSNCKAAFLDFPYCPHSGKYASFGMMVRTPVCARCWNEIRKLLGNRQ